MRNAVRGALPGVDILQVVHIIGPESLEEARRASVASDYVLLDSGRASARPFEPSVQRESTCAPASGTRADGLSGALLSSFERALGES